MSERVPCSYCGGTGQVAVDKCVEMVGTRRCKRLRVNDPVYFERFPEHEHLKAYCGHHRNQYVRALKKGG